jgi:DNA polymerase-3 subunit gamma/tau
MIFEDVVGQSHVTATLKNALASGKIAHAYIFSGTRGCGKTTTARILARAVNCESPKEYNPDNSCAICEEIVSGRSMDVIEIDGASNRGIEEIRNLRESVRYAPSRGAYKIYIIDEVHMLTKEAFNALLKTLEEPPPHVIFVFATTEIHKVPMTILSRCQRFDFRRIATEEVVQRLSFIATEEKVQIDEDALTVIAKKGDGSMRDAQSIFDQVHAFCGDAITTDDVVRSGYDLREFVKGLGEHYRNLLVASSTGTTDLLDMSASFKKRYSGEVDSLKEGDLVRILKIIHDMEQSLRFAHQPRYKLEATMVQLARIESTTNLKDLIERLEKVKTGAGKTLAPGRGQQSSEGNASSAHQADRTNIQVVGAVNAGPMTSPVAQRYSSFFNKQATSVTPMPAEEAPPAAAVAASASPETIESRWQEVVNDVLRTRIAIGTTLSESVLLGVQSGTLRIGCPDEYHVSTLNRHKEFIADTVFKLLGARVLVEPVLKSEKASVITYEPKTVEEDVKSVIKTKSEDEQPEQTHSPVLEALKRELGAERIE